MRKVHIVLLLVFFMLLSSCSSSDKGIESFDTSLDTELNSHDLNGAVIRFQTGWSEEWLPEVGFTEMGDNQRKRYSQTENEFNCSIRFIHSGFSSSEFSAKIAAQNDVPDLLDYHSHEVYSSYEAGFLYPWDYIETIDITDEKWGNKKFIRYGNYGGLQYGTFAYEWEFIPAILGICAFDSTLVSRLGVELPFELLENNKWTWEKFREISEKGTFRNENDEMVYGCAYDTELCMAQTVLFSNGAEVAREDGNGGIVCALDEPSSLEALQWLQDLVSVGACNKADRLLFNDNHILFYISESWYFTHMTQFHVDGQYPVYESDGYGIITFPNGPSGEYGTGGAFVTRARRLNWVCNFGLTDKDDLGLVADYMFNRLDGTESKAWKTFLEHNVFHYGKLDATQFFYMVENVHYDYTNELNSSDILTSVYIPAMTSKLTPASAVASKIDSINEKLIHSSSIGQ